MRFPGLKRTVSVRAVIAVVAAGATFAALPANAQNLSETVEASATLAELLPDSTVLHPDIIAYAPFANAEVHALTADLQAAVQRRDQAVADRLAAESERLVLASQLASNTASHRRWVMIESERQVSWADATDRLTDLAIGSFVAGDGWSLEIDALLGHVDSNLTLNQAAEDVLQADAGAAEEAHSEATAVIVDLEAAGREILSVMPLVDERWAQAEISSVAAVADISRIEGALEQAVVLAQVAGVGFPAVVLDAYYRAALATNASYPSCNIGWNQLAGIGQVETRHGTYGGSSVQADGSVEPHILGIVLDGSRSLAVSDTDGGVMDGNTVWDRAVGPMQFIPGSWRVFGADGNGDGVKDAHNLYDAAAAAGDHLCRSHSGLQSDAAFRTALVGYNRSTEYGTKVMNFAAAYGASISLDRPPVPNNEEEIPVVVAVTDDDSTTEVPAEE